MKRRKVKLIIICCLLMNMICIFWTLPVLASDREDDLRDELLEEYADDPEFMRMCRDNPQLANEYIEDLVQDRLNQSNGISILSTDPYGKEAYCTVPVKTQTTATNCSAATLLQTMYGLGKQGNIVGSTDSAKQATLYNYTTNSSAPGARVESPAGTSLYVYEIVSYLNNQVSNCKYEYTVGTSLSLEQFKSRIWNSLVHNRPVMLHAKTKYLSYYNNTNLAHYLSLDYYNRENETVRIKDCNYNSTYGGSHSGVPVREAYYTIYKESGRYLIAN